MGDLQSGAVTFVFTDIEGSTRLLKLLRERYRDVLADHDRLLRAVFAAHGGHELGTQGDAFFVAFTNPRSALLAAVEAEAAVRSHPWPDGVEVKVRVGLHTGHAVASEGHYTGLAVHRAARICAAGHGGQILVSQATQTLLEDEEEDLGIVLADVGERRLKDFDRPVRLYQVTTDAAHGPLSSLRGAAELAEPPVAERRPARRPRLLALAVFVLALAAAVTVTAVLARGGGDDSSTASTAARIAVLLPGPPGRATDALMAPVYDGLGQAAQKLRVRTARVPADETTEGAPTPAELTKAAAALKRGKFDLAIVPNADLAAELVPTMRELTSTRFALLDVPPGWQTHLGRLSNATAFAFADRDAGYLAGYLSGLVERRRGPRLNGERIVSVIGGVRGIPSVDALVRGFAAGARSAWRRVKVVTAYSEDFGDQRRCQRIASRQIDAGSDIVFAAAGNCSFGALREAGIRGVWGVGVDSDRSYLGKHILASAVKRFDRATLIAARSLVEGTLPAGGTVVLGLEDDGVDIAGINNDVPASVKKAVAAAAERLRQRSEP